MLNEEKHEKLDNTYDELDARVHTLIKENKASIAGVILILNTLAAELAKEIEG